MVSQPLSGGDSKKKKGYLLLNSGKFIHTVLLTFSSFSEFKDRIIMETNH
jgi:hypothetical protein